MIDISDGLVQDTTHLAMNSGLCVELDLNKIPLPNIPNISNNSLLNAALYGGDDYELLFSCNPNKEQYLKKYHKQIISNLPILEILKLMRIIFEI